MALIISLSSCSTSSFLSRKYTPGTYVEHKANVPRTGLSVLEYGTANSFAPADPKVQKSPNSSMETRAGLALSEEKERPAESGARLSLLSLKDLRYPRLQQVKHPGIPTDTLIRRPQKNQSEISDVAYQADRSLHTGINALLFLAILVLVYFVLLNTTFVGLSALSLFFGLLIFFLFGFLILKIFLIVTAVFGIRCMRNAKREGLALPSKAIWGMVLAAFAMILFIFLSSRVPGLN
jgi:hypothetical protein